MVFEQLANLKDAIAKFSELAKVDDQLGFSQNQKLSALIMEIEHESPTIEQLTKIVTHYKDYCFSWTEHIRNIAELIRKFSIEESNGIIIVLKEVESEIYEMIKHWETLSDNDKLTNSTMLITDIKRSGQKLSDLFNKCKLCKEHIKKELKDMYESL